MRNLIATLFILIALAASGACGDDAKSNPTAKPATPAAGASAAVTPASTAASTSAASTPAATKPAASASPSGSKVEVAGIVGVVNANGNVIEIKRLSGASVTQVAVASTTAIRKATGGKITLKDIRTSDRIIASGKLNDRGDQLIATEITVQDVVPGAQPGG